MSKKELIDCNLLTSLLYYNDDTGKLYWKLRQEELFTGNNRHKSWNTRYAGKEAFTQVDSLGYKRGAIFKQKYRAHRVIWCMTYGSWPAEDIDHINGDKTDNRLVNLRTVSRQENCRNQRLRSDNSSGVTGVNWDNARGSWLVKIKANSKNLYLGRYESFEEACSVRKQAEITYGYHENHGRLIVGCK